MKGRITMKKLVSLSLAIIMAVALMPFASLNTEAADIKIIRIYSWNTEIQERVESVYKSPAGVELQFVITPTERNSYQNRLDKDLKENPGQIDIFLVESDYCKEYINSEYTLDLRNLGLTEQDTAQMYPYAVQIGTSNKGELKAAAWQVFPSVFIYRRSIAEKVLGNSDPEFVQTRVNTWNNFHRVAGMMKKEGYFMLSGYDDAYRTYTQTPSVPWVDKNGRIIISDGMKKWVDDTKMYADKGYNNKTETWQMEWFEGFNADSKVFGYFGPSWFVDYVISLWDDDSEDWAAVPGPAPSFWGGTWICVAKGSQNTAESLDLIKQLCVDQDNMYKLIEEFNEPVNNIAAMEAFAKTPFEHKILGGQNPFGIYSQMAKRVDARYLTDYDNFINQAFPQAMADYFNGSISKEEALDNFYILVVEKYAWLNVDEESFK